MVEVFSHTVRVAHRHGDGFVAEDRLERRKVPPSAERTGMRNGA